MAFQKNLKIKVDIMCEVPVYNSKYIDKLNCFHFQIYNFDILYSTLKYDMNIRIYNKINIIFCLN